jgi:hypothetical protein
MADKGMHLAVGQFEKPLDLAIGVALQSGRTQHGIGGCHGERRIVATHGGSTAGIVMLGSFEGVEHVVAVLFEKVGPALEASGPRPNLNRLSVRAYLRKLLNVNAAHVLHGCLLFSETTSPFDASSAGDLDAIKRLDYWGVTLGSP